MVMGRRGGAVGDRDIHRDSGRPFFRPDKICARIDSYIRYIYIILQCVAHYCLTFYSADTRDKRSLGYNVYYIHTIRYIIIVVYIK